MKVIKRDGHMVDYSPDKIEAAIMKANLEVDDEDQASSIDELDNSGYNDMME